MNSHCQVVLAFTGNLHSDWELNHPHYPLVIAGILILAAIILKLFGYKG